MLKVIWSIFELDRLSLGKRMIRDALDDLRYSHYTLVDRTDWSCDVGDPGVLGVSLTREPCRPTARKRKKSYIRSGMLTRR
jgi:hypothetical protein